jgi:hypothetical protein
VDLKAAGATIRVPKNDVPVRHVLETYGACLLETNARRGEQVDDGSTARMHAECRLADYGELLHLGPG